MNRYDAAHGAGQTGWRVVSVERIRAQFPALARREGQHTVAYFDGPGGTQVPRCVADAMSDYLLHHNANTHWSYPTSVETDDLLLRARTAIGDFLGAAADEVAFGANTTTLLFHIARAIGRDLSEGDEIVVTELDHHANVAPWQALARERGVVLRWLPLDTETFRHEEGALVRLLSPRTRVVAIGAASNALGTVSDVGSMVAMARAAGAVTVVDAVHYAPHHPVDVAAIGADFLLCSAYKFHGPHVGVVHGRTEAIETLDLPALEPAPDWVPECLETGTQNHEGIVGTAAAVDFLAALLELDEDEDANGKQAGFGRRNRLLHVMAELERRSEVLFVRLWDGLQQVDGVTLFGPPPGTPRTPTLAFRVRGCSSERTARALVPYGLFLSHGDFYATTVARRLGHARDGFVRAGCACYTTEDEVDRLVDAVSVLARGAS